MESLNARVVVAVTALLLGGLVAAQIAHNDIDRAVVDLRGGPVAGPRQPSGTSPRCTKPTGVTVSCVIAEEEASTSPAMAEDVVVASGGSRVIGFDADTLVQLWNTDASLNHDAQIASGGIVLVDHNTETVAHDAHSGERLWEAPRADSFWARPWSTSVLIVTDLTVTSHEAATGEVRWTADARRGDLVAEVGDEVYVTDADESGDPTDDVVLSSQDGSVLDVREIHEIELYSLPDSDVDVVLAAGRLTIEPAGPAPWSVEVADYPPRITRHRDRLLLAWEDRVDIHDIDTGELLWTFPALAPVVVSTTPLLVYGNGLVYRVRDDILTS